MQASDRDEIIQVINLYGLAVDTQRWALFDRIFTADADADFGGDAHWRELTAFKRDFAAFHAGFDSTQHAMSNHVVAQDGEGARALTYGRWLLIRRDTPGGDHWEGSGWYDDRLVRTPAGWRIVERVCRVVWWGGNPVVNGAVEGVEFTLPTLALKDEAAAGRLAALPAIERS